LSENKEQGSCKSAPSDRAGARAVLDLIGYVDQVLLYSSESIEIRVLVLMQSLIQDQGGIVHKLLESLRDFTTPLTDPIRTLRDFLNSKRIAREGLFPSVRCSQDVVTSGMRRSRTK
jgi:hypothetical protein